MISIREIGENPRLIWGLLRKYWMLVLLTVLLGLGTALVYNHCATPKYTSTISLLIWNRDMDKIGMTGTGIEPHDSNDLQVNEIIRYNNLVVLSLQVAQRLVPAFRKLINSTVVAKAAAKKLYNQHFTKPLKYSFECNIKMNSCIMDVIVTSPDPKLAVAAASALTESFAAEQERLMHVKYIQAITPASVPDSPSWPRKKVVLFLGLLAGLLIGSAVAFCFEMLDVTVKTFDDVKPLKLLHLGMVPAVTDIENLYRTKKFEHPGHLHVVVDAIRVINTTIDFLRVNNPLQVIAVTSALPNSGKTTNAIMLAKAMGAAQKRVLIIDCDLRKPQLRKVLSLSGNEGMVQFLMSPKGTDPDQSIHKDVFPGVDVMANLLIPPNPTELLGARQFREMLELFKGNYDCILLDCPPGLNMADAMVIGNIVDGIVLVIEAGHTKIGDLEHLLEQFGALRAKIIGTILNKVSSNHSKYSYYYYYGGTKNRGEAQPEPETVSDPVC
ncbi:MAG: polysaccharide biosynthesis tyrosine autokinase [Victivallaceae bacterium]|nr:polysaccharide biosynthesis tyrosine autokinase [Victivallaceae bacterium]